MGHNILHQHDENVVTLSVSLCGISHVTNSQTKKKPHEADGGHASLRGSFRSITGDHVMGRESHHADRLTIIHVSGELFPTG